MLNVKKLLTKILEYQKDFCKVVRWTDSSQSVTGYGGLSRTGIDISSAIPSGYKAVMATMEATGSYAYYSYYCALASSTTVTYQIGNRESSAKTVQPSIQILCIRT